MEFSEISELNRIAKSIQIFKSSDQLRKIPTISISLNGDSSPVVQLSLKSSPESRQGSLRNETTSTKPFQQLHFERDNSYLQAPFIVRRSSLTESLLNNIDSRPLSPLKQLVIEVYFFRTVNKLKLILPMDITVAGLLSKALITYRRSNISGLPYGLDSNGYQVWVSEDENHIPDTDYILNSDLKVSSLGVNVLCICEKKGYIDRSSYKVSKSIINRQSKDRLLIKFYFEDV